MKNRTGFWASLMLITGLGFALSLTSVLETSFIEFNMNETLELEVTSNESYYLLYNSVIATDFYEVSQSTIYSLIDFYEYPYLDISLFANVRQNGTNERFYLEGFGEYSSVKLNGLDALGIYDLEKGTYQITISPASNDALTMQDDFVFTLAPADFTLNILVTVFAGIATFILFFIFVVSFAKRQKALNDMSEFDGTTYRQQSSDMELFDASDDDVYAKYSERR